MYPFRGVLGVLVAVLALEIAFLDAQPLPSASQPLTAASTKGINLYLVVQEDGTATFSISGSSSAVYSVIIPAVYRGESYHVIDGTAGGADVAVVNGSHIFTMRCKSNFHSCSPTTASVPLPFTSSNPKSLAMRMFHEDPNVVAIATADTIVTFNLANMRVISNITWAFKNHYTLNHASGMRYSGTGDDYYVVAMANKDSPGDPGVVIRIVCDANGHLFQNTPLIITYMTIAPMNYVTSRSYPSVRYWSQTDTKGVHGGRKAFISSFNSVAPHHPVSPHLSHDQVISPSFVGEYSGIQAGAMAVGNIHVMGWSRICLHFGYGMSSGPEIAITQQHIYSTNTGLPFLGFQLDYGVPTITAVAKTASGWTIIKVDFGNCPESASERERSQQSELPKAPQNTSHTSEDFNSSSLELEPHTLPKTCRESTCTIDELGDCPEQHCWSLAHSGRFVCCHNPPI